MAKGRSRLNFEAPGTNLSEAKERVMSQGIQASGRGVYNHKRGTIEHFAEEMDRLMSSAERTVHEWLEQRNTVEQRLTHIRDTANALLRRLGADAASGDMRSGTGNGPGGRGTSRRGRPPGSRKKKRTMSAEARARIGAAQRARWARQRKASHRSKA